jgi:hypothetical protein
MRGYIVTDTYVDVGIFEVPLAALKCAVDYLGPDIVRGVFEGELTVSPHGEKRLMPPAMRLRDWIMDDDYLGDADRLMIDIIDAAEGE